MTILLYLVLSFTSLHLLVVLYNYRHRRYLKGYGIRNFQSPSLSILIPCRNEEHNIERVLSELSTQTIIPEEVIVLDDHSTDSTLLKVQNFMKNTKMPVRAISGEELPKGWLGKNWACYQLSNYAKGEWLVFLDADVQLSNTFIDAIKTEIETKSSDMFSVFPTQKKRSELKMLLVPMMNWLLIGFLPVRLVNTSKNASFAAANGQCMVFRRQVYEAIGGHSSVAECMVEDIELVRLIKKRNFTAKVLYGGEALACEMYTSTIESFHGYSKNFYPGFRVGYAGFSVFLLFLFVVFLSPFIMVIISPLFFIPVAIILLCRLLIAKIAHDSMIASVFLHCIQIPLMLILGYLSMYKYKTKTLTWKNRILR